MPDLPWPHAGRRVHHPGLGDRPDPRASPDPRRARGVRRAAEPLIEAGPDKPGPATRAACRAPPPRPPPEHGLVAPPPRGKLWRGRPSHRRDRWVSVGIAPHADGRSHDAHGARARGRARRHPSRGAGEIGDRALCSTYSRPTPIEIPIPRVRTVAASLIDALSQSTRPERWCTTLVRAASCFMSGGRGKARLALRPIVVGRRPACGRPLPPIRWSCLRWLLRLLWQRDVVGRNVTRERPQPRHDRPELRRTQRLPQLMIRHQAHRFVE